MPYTFPFEKLEVWQEARKFVKDVFRTTDSFPPKEQFVLTAQIRRAAISVASNIAGGDGRFRVKDQLRFFTLAWSSLMDVFNQFMIAYDLGYITVEELDRYRAMSASIANKLNALYRYRQKNADNKPEE